MNAYDGSQVHFLRSAYSGKVKEEGFFVNEVSKFPNPKYPKEKELQHLKDFTQTLKTKKQSLSLKIYKKLAVAKHRNPL
ncbi:hypothetical protein [Chryseobacterium indoltheticum]|uniref:hypothetical protein n=1 Tax=Chryseobacterium indoltheticum TaxID=254 RepID=UPI003F497654